MRLLLENDEDLADPWGEDQEFYIQTMEKMKPRMELLAKEVLGDDQGDNTNPPKTNPPKTNPPNTNPPKTNDGNNNRVSGAAPLTNNNDGNNNDGNNNDDKQDEKKNPKLKADAIKFLKDNEIEETTELKDEDLDKKELDLVRQLREKAQTAEYNACYEKLNKYVEKKEQEIKKTAAIEFLKKNEIEKTTELKDEDLDKKELGLVRQLRDNAQTAEYTACYEKLNKYVEKKEQEIKDKKGSDDGSLSTKAWVWIIILAILAVLGPLVVFFVMRKQGAGGVELSDSSDDCSSTDESEY
jgi:hypothetical protein